MNKKIEKIAANINTDVRTATQSATIPTEGFLRVWQIVGSKKKNIQGIIPISRSSFLAGVKSGKYPAGVKLGARTTAWKASDIRRLIDELGA